MPHKHSPNSGHERKKREARLNYLRTGFYSLKCPVCRYEGIVYDNPTVGDGRAPTSAVRGVYCPKCGYERALSTYHSGRRKVFLNLRQ
jgi:hypothetical protein